MKRKMIQLTTLTKRAVLAVLLSVAFCQAKAALFINEVSGNDKWIEIYNSGTTSVNLSGYKIIKIDETGLEADWTIQSATIPAGGFLSWRRNANGSFTWGISAKKDVTFKLFNTGGTLLDVFEIKNATTTFHSEGLSRTVGRKTDGAAELVIFRDGGSRGQANSTGTIQTPTPQSDRKKLYVNEVSGNGKWIEVYNAGSEEINLTDYSIQKIDEQGNVDNHFFEGNPKIAAGKFRSWKQYDVFSFTWGISGKKDVAFKIFDPNGTELDYFEIKESLYSEGLNRTVGRKTDGAAELVIFRDGGSRNTTNNEGTIQVPTPVNERKKICINEISGNEKWLEIYNNGTEEVDLTNYSIRKIDELKEVDNWFIPAGTKIAPKSFLSWEQDETIFPSDYDKTTHTTFTWGISARKDLTLRVYDPNGTQLDAFEVTMPDMNSEGDNRTVGRIPDATGSPKVLLIGTRGAENQNNISVDEVFNDNILKATVSEKTLYLSDDVTNVSIISLLGITVTSQSNSSGNTISLAAIPSGVYLVRLSNGKHQKIQKILLN